MIGGVTPTRVATNPQPPDNQSPSPSLKRAAVLGVTLALAAGGALVVWEPWHGPILISVSAEHGVNAGDLLSLPFVALALVVSQRHLRDRPRSHRAVAPPRQLWAPPISEVVLGCLLLFVGIGILIRGSILLPAGGGTFDGTVAYVGGDTGSAVGAWTHVAVTFDGDTLRMFVDGLEVSHDRVSGIIQDSTAPLWIGGNSPYGEYFEGVIDELRVYNRALDPSEIVTDMNTPVEPMPRRDGAATSTGRIADAHLVASYAFDAGAGTEVMDSSGHGNDGTITGATWTTEGKYGPALSFGGGDVVRVPAARSLDLGSAMTLSAWTQPSVPQDDWRTIVQRETDSYFLHASSGLWDPIWPVDDAVAAVVVAAAAIWFVLDTRPGRVGNGGRRGNWYLAVALFLVGCLLDAAFSPAGTVFCGLLLAAWFAGTRRGHVEVIIGWGAVAVLTLVTVVSLADHGEVGIRLARDDGSHTRAGALGGLLVLSGVLGCRSARSAAGTRHASKSARAQPAPAIGGRRRADLSRATLESASVVDVARPSGRRSSGR